MRRWRVFGASALLLLAGCGIHSPDLTPDVAAQLISKAPEFNRYARLLKVESMTRQADSMAYCCYYGFFTFRYLNVPNDVPMIKAYAEFRYWEGTWHFTAFDYGCDHSGLIGGTTASDCHSVQCYNPLPK
jgi:hypothetical protein